MASDIIMFLNDIDGDRECLESIKNFENSDKMKELLNDFDGDITCMELIEKFEAEQKIEMENMIEIEINDEQKSETGNVIEIEIDGEYSNGDHEDRERLPNEGDLTRELGK